MRRLTKFEKKIVKRIVSDFETFDYISFKELVQNPILNYVGFEFKNKVIAGYLDIVGFKNDKRIPKSEDDFDTIKRFYNSMFNTALLLKLLEENNLIIFNSKSFAFDDDSYIGKEFEEGEIKNRFLLNANEALIKIYKEVSKGITPTPALEIYVENGFKTEEQKHNHITRWAGWGTLAAAVIGLLITSIFSLLTYTYTKNKDKEDAIAEAKKDSLNDLYRNELMLNLDRVAEGLTKKAPEQIPVKK